MTITDASPDAPTAPGLDPVWRTVSGFLAAVERGRPEDLTDLYATDATLDATVPNWRFGVRGAAVVVDTYRGWFTHPGAFEELEWSATPDGAVVTYLLAWLEDGDTVRAHHCHVLRLDGAGQITSDVVFCGGRWPSGLVAEMAG